jgi:hypothetical protein
MVKKIIIKPRLKIISHQSYSNSKDFIASNKSPQIKILYKSTTMIRYISPLLICTQFDPIERIYIFFKMRISYLLNLNRFILQFKKKKIRIQIVFTDNLKDKPNRQKLILFENQLSSMWVLQIQ